VTGEPQWKTDNFGKDIKTWEVTFDEWENENGTPTVEDFDFHELLANQASRPRNPSLGDNFVHSNCLVDAVLSRKNLPSASGESVALTIPTVQMPRTRSIS
jgi:hypothetical protein